MMKSEYLLTQYTDLNMSIKDMLNRLSSKGYKIKDNGYGFGFTVTDKAGISRNFPSVTHAYRWYFSSIY